MSPPPYNAAAPAPKKSKKTLWIVLGVVAGIIVISTIGRGIGGGDSEAKDKKPEATTSAPAESTAPEEAPSATPEATPEETEAPPAEAGTVENPMSQPYVAKGLLGGEKYSLTAKIYSSHANAEVEEWNQFNTDAPAGFKYVIVELTMTGIDKDGVNPSLASFDLQLATGEGNTYDAEVFLVMGDGMASMSEGPKLYPGSSFTGFVAYVVPESAESFLLHDNRKYISF